MYNISYINSFIFNNVTYSDYHHGNFASGVKHNYLMYLKRGRAEIVSENKTITLNEGDILHIPRGMKYDAYLYGVPEIEFYSYGYLNYPSNISKNYNSQKIEPSDRIMELVKKLTLDNTTNCRTLGIFFFCLMKFSKALKALLIPTKISLL